MIRPLAAGALFGFALLAHQDAQAAAIDAPGEIRVHVDFGIADIAGLKSLQFESGEMGGEINRRGRITMSARAINIPPTTVDTMAGMFEIIPRASDNAIGMLDPISGRMRLAMRMNFGIVSPTVDLGERCRIEGIEMVLVTNDVGELHGERYDSETGEVVLVDGQVDAPGLVDCAPEFTSILEGAFGLPDYNGGSWMELSARVLTVDGNPIQAAPPNLF